MSPVFICNISTLASFGRDTAQFVWDLVGNPADNFCHNTAQMAKDKGTKCHGLVHLFHYIKMVERNMPHTFSSWGIKINVIIFSRYFIAKSSENADYHVCFICPFEAT